MYPLSSVFRSVQNSLTQVITHSTVNTTSALNSLYWLPFSNKLIINWLLLSIVLSTTSERLHLNTRHRYYVIHTVVSFSLPPSVSSSHLVSIMLSPLLIFCMLEFPSWHCEYWVGSLVAWSIAIFKILYSTKLWEQNKNENIDGRLNENKKNHWMKIALDTTICWCECSFWMR